MILSLWDTIQGWFDDFGKFVEEHYNEPFFWIIIFAVLALLSFWVIKELADK